MPPARLFASFVLNPISTGLSDQTSAGLMRKYRMEHPEYFREEVERQFNEPTP